MLSFFDLCVSLNRRTESLTGFIIVPDVECCIVSFSLNLEAGSCSFVRGLIFAETISIRAARICQEIGQ
jgi:hypothetical protein